MQRLLLLLLIASLTACQPAAPPDNSASAPAEEKTEEKKEEAKSGQLDKPGDTTEANGNKMTLVKIARPEESVETGPMTLTVKTVALTEFEPSEQMAGVLQKEGEFTLASLTVEVENASDDTVSFYPDQATIVAGQEQAQANLILTEQVGGDFIGKVKKTGKVAFVLDTPAEDIESFKVVVNAPNNKQLQSMGNEVTMEFEF
ncbi:MAG: hypothetical protein J7647_27270 [Cyanobacteria bacterium SBLK]|nr:hypothetical protein [Cyanobacteria bacterium SBLK]